jgi:negative regulator of replication initiation
LLIGFERVNPKMKNIRVKNDLYRYLAILVRASGKSKAQVLNEVLVEGLLKRCGQVLKEKEEAAND